MKFDFDDESIRSIGEFLRRVREQQEISLDDAAEGTRINRRFLEAIEEDREEELPTATYADLFIKSYAEFLGIEAEEVLLRLPERKPKTKKKKAAAAEESAAKQGAPNRPTLPPAPKHIAWSRFALLLALVVVVVGAIFFFSKGDAEDGGTPGARIITPQPRETDSSELAMPQDSIFLLLVGKERCWLDVRVDGDSVYTKFLGEQDTARFAIADSVAFKLGKANAVQGWLNGLPLKLATADDSATAQFQMDKLNYQRYIDSSRLVE